MNAKVEQELIDFKREIERKYANSKMNHTYRFPKTEKRYKPVIRKRDIRYSTVTDEEEDGPAGDSSSAGLMYTEAREEEGQDELEEWMGDLVVEEYDVIPNEVPITGGKNAETESSLFGKVSGPVDLN